MTVGYREGYTLWACNGILFNHESPRRGETFVTRKITMGLAAIKAGRQQKLYLGNLDAKRDWGYAPEYVEGMWLMLQQDIAQDFVLATGENHAVRSFVDTAARRLGFDIEWSGSGPDEQGIDRRTGKTLVRVNPAFYRPAEVDVLIGNPKKAQEILGWKRKIGFEELVTLMAEADDRRVRDKVALI
jgi:GDPmannose 4,6-dehydratase